MHQHNNSKNIQSIEDINSKKAYILFYRCLTINYTMAEIL